MNVDYILEDKYTLERYLEQLHQVDDVLRRFLVLGPFVLVPSLLYQSSHACLASSGDDTPAFSLRR
jgi:hypothetical protein